MDGLELELFPALSFRGDHVRERGIGLSPPSPRRESTHFEEGGLLKGGAKLAAVDTHRDTTRLVGLFL